MTNQDLAGNQSIDDGRWHHVAGVYDGEMKYLYVDGELDASQAGTGTINSSDEPVRIGLNQFEQRYWNGNIDEVRIWNIARTQSQIQESMLSELYGWEEGLMAYYNLNEVISVFGAPIVLDITDNGHSGILLSSTESDDIPNFSIGAPVNFIDDDLDDLGNPCDNMTTNISNLNSSKENINIYPNPFKDKISIDFELYESKIADITLIDLTGREIKQIVNRQRLTKGEHHIELYPNDLLPSVYYLKIQLGIRQFGKGLIHIP